VTHRRTFLQINELRKGDRIYFTTRRGRFTYRVVKERVVRPQAIWVLRRTGREQLVLTACHPPRTARFRYVVFAVRIA
jgi:LPXTG-site transpeptidase (sortase) family protein